MSESSGRARAHDGGGTIPINEYHAGQSRPPAARMVQSFHNRHYRRVASAIVKGVASIGAGM
eukprot:6709202-Pyramimonas_sp.AAC.1